MLGIKKKNVYFGKMLLDVFVMLFLDLMLSLACFIWFIDAIRGQLRQKGGRDVVE